MRSYLLHGLQFGAASAMTWVVGWHALHHPWMDAMVLGALGWAAIMAMAVTRGLFAMWRAARSSK